MLDIFGVVSVSAVQQSKVWNKKTSLTTKTRRVVKRMKKSYLILVASISTILFIYLMSGISIAVSDDDAILELIETAETPEDHIKIVNYYMEQTERMEKMASKHEAMAEAYKEGGESMSIQRERCVKLSEESKATAKEYKAMAIEHEKIAHEMMNHESQ